MFGRRGRWEGEENYLFCDVSNCRQHAQHVEEAVVVVGALDGAAAVALWQLLEDFRRDELRAEERRVGVCHGVPSVRKGVYRGVRVLQESAIGVWSAGARNVSMFARLAAWVIDKGLSGAGFEVGRARATRHVEEEWKEN